MNKYIVTVIQDTTNDYYGSHEYHGTYFVKSDSKQGSVLKLIEEEKFETYWEHEGVSVGEDFDFILKTGGCTVWSFDVVEIEEATWYE